MNAYKSILVHLDTSPQSLARLHLADQLAERFEGQVTALYASTPFELIDPMGLAIDASLAPLLQDAEVGRRARVRALFDDAVASGMSRLSWAELSWSEPLRAFGQHALYADLVLLGQPERHGARSNDVPSDFIVSVLADSGRPALVLPYIGVPATLARRVLVAWKPTREAMRALSAALPLLQAADRVDVACWTEDGAGPAASPLQLETYLRRHGVDARVHGQGEASREVGERLLSLAADLDSDLLVMGCYGHARVREWVLGGVTRTVLGSMTLPVLMAH
jgi:nucleotide-binding universal stress UspA family protein